MPRTKVYCCIPVNIFCSMYTWKDPFKSTFINGIQRLRSKVSWTKTVVYIYDDSKNKPKLMYEKNGNKQKTVRKYKETSSRGLNFRERKQFKQISQAFEMRIQIISFVVRFFLSLMRRTGRNWSWKKAINKERFLSPKMLFFVGHFL